eukprot:m.281382 g.281382  ORF g.281382 m.281382 type:complete len:650 (+) comp19838_c0_seq9:195-2144(+)
MLSRNRALGTIVFAIAINVLLVPFTTLSPTPIELGNKRYDIAQLSAPALTGTPLQLLAWLVSYSPLNSLLCRYLLNGNNIHILREVGRAIGNEAAPLYFPMSRENSKMWHDWSEYANEFTLKDLLDSDTNANPLYKHGYQSKPRSKHRKYNTVMDYACAYREKGISPTVVMQRTLAAIEDFKQQGLIIFSSIRENEVLSQAQDSTKRFLNKSPLGIFDGVPVVFKDMMSVKGHVICAGQRANGEGTTNSDNFCSVVQEDDPIVAHFREAGAIILGVTVMTEGGVTPLGFNVHWQGPHSAYHTSRYSGGSSSGSAVAVATNLVPVAIGFDGGGSIRIPAAMSGIFGLGTTFGRVPFTAEAKMISMIKTGPMTHSAVDAAMVFAMISQNQKGSYYNKLYDGDNIGPPPAHLAGFANIHNLQDVTLGIFPDWFNDSDQAVTDMCYAAVRALESRGARVVNISIPHLHAQSLAHGAQISTEFALTWDSMFHHRAHHMEDNTKITIALAKTFSSLEVTAGQKLRGWAFQYVKDLFVSENLTAIVTPTIPIPPPVLSDSAKVRGESNTALVVQVMKYIQPGNFLGLPGLTVPVGYTEHRDDVTNGPDYKLPVGLHLMGNHWHEHDLLRLGNALDDALENARHSPPEFFASDMLAP